MTDNEPSTMQIRMYVHVHVYNHLNFNAIQHSVIWHTLSRMQFLIHVYLHSDSKNT